MEKLTAVGLLSLAIVCDIVSGVIRSFVSGTFKSSEMRTGLLKKILDYCLLVVAFVCSRVLGLDYIERGTATALTFMELASVVENCRDMVAIPKVLQDAITENSTTEETEENNEDAKG